MKKLLAEPLLHFLVLGAALFGAYALLGRRHHTEGPGRSNRFESRKRTSHGCARRGLVSGSASRTDRELRGLLADYLKEEILSREARALGLDRDDVIVRRRLAQKMTFLVEDTAQLAEPADEDLRRTYDAHPERFQEPARITFSHVYFNRDRRGQAAIEDAKRALAELSRDGSAPDPSVIGDRSLVPGAFANTEEREVAGQFGPAFAKEVFALPVGSWHGPVESGSDSIS